MNVSAYLRGKCFFVGVFRRVCDAAAGQPSRCVEDTKQAHWNQKLMTSLSTMMTAPWARYDESYTIPPPELDDAGFPVNDGVDRTLTRTVYFNRVTGVSQYERPEAGMMRDVRTLSAHGHSVGG